MKKAALLLVILLSNLPIARGETPGTLRVDYFHSGNAMTEMYSLDKVVIEPLPWPGHPDGHIDTTNRGSYRFEVLDPVTLDVQYSRGFGSIFGEWQTTSEAREINRGFHESVRFPLPDEPVRLRISRRDEAMEFSEVWSILIDPADPQVVRASPPPAGTVKKLIDNGDPVDKVDLLFIGDGYTAAEAEQFEDDVRRLSGDLFGISPFKEYADQFNVWAIHPPAPESGSNRPSSGIHRYSPTGTTYDAFGAERYVLAFDNAGLREIAQQAPYEHLIILANMETYGGGGIFNLYATVAAQNDWAWYLMIHEFGHSFAGLADEYYTSPDVYDTSSPLRPEPWEPNVTALHDPQNLKWADRVSPDTPVPTPWPKEEFEAFQKENQAKRQQLRDENRPESEMSALFRREQQFVEELFSEAPHHNVIGAFEGANYQANGYYRPAMNCMMFTRTDFFCGVCTSAIEDVIRLSVGE